MHPINKARKQNSSCDQCRRSKRRCELPTHIQHGQARVCSNCLHLGQDCTFDFVTSRLHQKREKASTLDQPVAASSTQCLADKQINAVGLSPKSCETVHTASDETLWEEFTTNVGLLGTDMFLGNLASEWANLMNGNDESSHCATRPVRRGSMPSATSRSSNISRHHKKFTQGNGRGAVGAWRGSPIHLLNSSVELLWLNQSLGEIYECMMAGIAIRYLDYNCNLFAGSYRYSFDANRSCPSVSHQDAHSTMARTLPPAWKRSSSSGGPAEYQDHASRSMEVLSTRINKVTMIGIARFLDNFSSLYCNVIGANTRKQNERILTAALQAFALQFAPSSPTSVSEGKMYTRFNSADDGPTPGSSSGSQNTNSSRIFITAWLNTHSLLTESNQPRSFVRLYAVFLFLMTTIPSEANTSGGMDIRPLDILDDALHQMQELQSLIDGYCANFEANSIYRFLLQSCLGIFGWYAYLRDTISSVLNPRVCILNDAPVRLKGLCLTSRPIFFSS